MTRKKTKEAKIEFTEEEKTHIDKLREAKERQRTNATAFRLIVLSDQGRTQFEQVEVAVEESLIAILSNYEEIKRNKGDIISGKTEKKNSRGEVMGVRDLEIENMGREKIVKQYMNLLRSDLSAMFSYIDTIGLDGEIFFTEEDWNAKVKDVMDRLAKTPYKLL